jgi:predicted Zn-dependent protease
MFSNRMQFHVVNSKTINAFTTGGEHMYVYNALLQMCKTEDELAAVMSHEFAHVYCRHVQQGTNRQYAQLGAAGLAAVAGYAAGGKEHGAEYAGMAGGGALAVSQFIGMGYTRHDEAQADEYGFAFYSLAGWDPDHFGDFFQDMINAGYDKTPTMLSDHPMLRDRVVAAKQRAADWKAKHDDQFKKAPIADPAQFAQIKARAAQIAASTPDDQSLQKAQGLLASFSSCVTPGDEQPEQVAARKRLDEAVAAQQKQQGQTQQSQPQQGQQQQQQQHQQQNSGQMPGL